MHSKHWRAAVAASLNVYRDSPDADVDRFECSDTSTVGEVSRAVIEDEDWLVVAFRGTADIADVFTDVDAVAVAAGGGLAHGGFVRAAESVMPLWQKIVGRFPRRRVLFTGHSLGGAIAQLSVCERWPNCVTFGAPRVGDRDWAAGVDDACWLDRLEASNDFVPRMPHYLRASPHGQSCWTRHAGRQVLLTEDGHVIVSPSRFRRALERIVGWRFDSLRDHYLGNYLAIVESHCHG